MKKVMRTFRVVVGCLLVVSITVPNVLAYSNRIPINGTLETAESQIYELGYFEDTTDAVNVKIKLSTSNIDRAGIVTVHYLVSGYTYDKGVIYPQVTRPPYTDEHEFILSGLHGGSGEVAILIEHSINADCPVTYSGMIEW